MKIDPVTELMELVLKRSGGLYLSDLHGASRSKRVAEAICGIPTEKFSARAWSGLAEYIAGGELAFDTGEEAKAAILWYLEHLA